MTREELEHNDGYQIGKASEEFWKQHRKCDPMTAFEAGIDWRDKNPSVEILMKIFKMFDEHGLIRDDLCFDPEHFMETVIKEHWND